MDYEDFEKLNDKELIEFINKLTEAKAKRWLITIIKLIKKEEDNERRRDQKEL